MKAEQTSERTDGIVYSGDLHPVEGRPLIAFLVGAYNHEKCIRAAVEGAFSQTYSPLIIILSDDDSSDQTFTIMKEMAESYHGPHRVLLNRNDKNMGLMPHVNKLFELTSTLGCDLIVASAGDDISVPHRTEKLWAAWENANRMPKMVSSGMTRINSGGESIGEWTPPEPGMCLTALCQFILDPHHNFHGASAMYHRDIFDTFGPLSLSLVEDTPMIIRSRILGPILALPDHLVNYRIHANNMTGFLDPDYKAKMMRGNAWRISIYEQIIHDVKNEKIRKQTSPDEVEKIVRQCQNKQKEHKIRNSLTSPFFIVRLCCWVRLLFRVSPVESLNNVVYLIPPSQYQYIMKYGLPINSKLLKSLMHIKRNIISSSIKCRARLGQ